MRTRTMAASNEQSTTGAEQTTTGPTESGENTETESLRDLSVEEFRNKLAFDADVQGLPTTHALIVRDTSEVLIYIERSCNSDGKWAARSVNVLGDRVQFATTDRERADIAAIMVEEFDADDLTVDDEYTQQTPIKHGIPTAIAVDGEPAIAAWLFYRGGSYEQVAHEMGVNTETAADYISQFRQRATGTPDGMDLPEYDELVPEVPERFDPDPNGQTTLEELGELS